MEKEELELIKAQTLLIKHLTVTVSELNSILKQAKPIIEAQMQLAKLEKN